MAVLRKYSILSFDESNHKIHVVFHGFDNVKEINIPIENNKYIIGEELDKYILTHAPIVPNKIEINVENKDEIKKLTNQKLGKLYEKSLHRNRIIEQRNMLLLASDWSQLPDAQEQLDVEDKKLWKEYRQALRDMTKQPGWPENIDWPKRPHILGVAIFE